MKKSLSFFFLFLVLSCSKNDADDATLNLSETGLELSDFIWKGLNQYYYWQEDVPNLANSKTDNSNEYAQFIQRNPNPKSFFESLLYAEDRFSWIVDDYIELENSFQGIVASNGMEFSLFRQEEGSNDLVGWIKYVHEDSDAKSKELRRGEIFTHVNEQLLTEDNFVDLLYSDALEYTIGMANYTNGAYALNGRNIELIKEENFQKNPLHVQNVIEIGEHRIGYLMYNQFASSFNEPMNEAFAEFTNQGITELILDLRYNRGGSISTCTYLASLITGQFNNEVFAQELWNSKLMEYWQENNEESLYNRFTNQIEGGSSLNSLQMERVFILTSDETASASELLINGLKPYIDVVQIGESTVGKNVGSITVYDYIDNDRTKNPNHFYAMQPIVLAIANSEGIADYTEGLVPDINRSESRINAGVLGERDETLLAEAIRQITGSGKTYSRDIKIMGPKIKDPLMISEQSLLIDRKIFPH
tara:strand:- start:90 stop:1517 length:1428 start_codon:yes stop_codon:yes gene_type:complete